MRTSKIKRFHQYLRKHNYHKEDELSFLNLVRILINGKSMLGHFVL